MENSIMYSSFAGLLVMALCMVGFVRSLRLLDEAKRDRDDLAAASLGITTMLRFFVHANYVHLTKYTIAFLTGLAIFLTGFESFTFLFIYRLVEVPIALSLIILLAVTLGELEAKARRFTREYYRKQRTTRGGS